LAVRRRYNLSAWAIKLNEITPGLEGKLAPTDCRLRPDQHATEAGDYDEVRAPAEGRAAFAAGARAQAHSE
jgi:Oxysterol-binding protein